MKHEEKRKRWWLSALNREYPGWVDDDLVGKREQKTVDLVNRKRRVAIEIKQGMGLQGARSRTLANRFTRHIKEANKKFQNYPEFKTAIIFELKEHTPLLHQTFIALAVEKQKKTRQSIENVGGFILWPLFVDRHKEHKVYYRVNPHADRSRIISEEDLEALLNSDIETIIA